jgi:hypothetical protein
MQSDPSPSAIEAALRKQSAQECPSVKNSTHASVASGTVHTPPPSDWSDKATPGEEGEYKHISSRPVGTARVTVVAGKTFEEAIKEMAEQGEKRLHVSDIVPAKQEPTAFQRIGTCLDAGIGIAFIIPFSIFDGCILWKLVPMMVSVMVRDVLRVG